MSFLNAAKQGNTLNQKSAGLDFPMHPQRLSNGTRLLPVEPGQRDMRPESSPLLCEPGKYQSMTKRPLQSGQLIHRLNPGPEIFRAIRVTETTNPGHGEVKRFHRQIPGSIANIRKPMCFYTAQKCEGQVQLVRPLPPRPGDRLLDSQQPLFDRVRNLQPEEQAKSFWLIQSAPQTIPETGAGNTRQSCRIPRATPSPVRGCLSVHRLPPVPAPARLPIQSR